MKYIIFIVAAILLYFSASAFAQQRIIVEKETGNVVDVGDNTLQYDQRFFDNLDYPGKPIAEGVDFRKYMRDASGNLVLRPQEELKKAFDSEWQNDLISRISASRLPAELRELLIEIVTNISR